MHTNVMFVPQSVEKPQIRGKHGTTGAVLCVALTLFCDRALLSGKAPRTAHCLKHLKTPFQTPGFSLIHYPVYPLGTRKQSC